MLKSQMEINVHVNGRPVKEYVHQGAVYVEGKKDSKYSIKLKNNSGGRVMAVISVDGLDVIKGKSAVDADSGYIINAYSSIEIKGYRIDNDNIAEFVFDGSDRSYATEKSGGNKTNNGVIGVRFFAEKEKPKPEVREVHHYHHDNWPYYPRPIYVPRSYPIIYKTNTEGSNKIRFDSEDFLQGTTKCSNTFSNETYAPSSNNMSFAEESSACSFMETETVRSFTPPTSVPANDLGTAWGSKVSDRVKTVEFETGNLISQIELYYSSRTSLEQIGIDFSEKKQITATRPLAFGYCEPPKNWSNL